MSDAQGHETDELALTHEPGLSSAMHDIRMLARGYREHHERSAPKGGLELGGVTMTPSFLLQPSRNTSKGRESWKGIALTLMVLLGLSTSALALSLFASTRAGDADASIPLLLDPVETPVVVSSQGPAATFGPSELLASYALPSSPGTSPRPETHDAITPKATRRAIRKTRAPVVEARTEVRDSCDEVACLIDSSAACCQAYESVRAADSSLEESPVHPYRLTRKQIMEPMQSISGRVESCADTYGYEADVASIKLVVSAQGQISSFALGQGSSGFQACVEKQVRTLHFPELSQPFSFSYPFTL